MHGHLTCSEAALRASACPHFPLETKLWGKDQVGHTVIASLKRMEQHSHFLTPSHLFSEVSLCGKAET